MTMYAFKVRDGRGKLVKGQMEAASDADLAERLKKEGFIPVDINEAVEEGPKEGIEAYLNNKIKTWSDQFIKIKVIDMVMLNFQLANLISAGIPLLRSLNTISQQIQNERLKAVILDVAEQISGGSSFSEALAKHPSVFSSLFVNVVKSGEVSGKLSESLTRYANYIEEQDKINQKIKNALFYPAILIVVSATVISIIVMFVIPKFMVMFQRADVALPLPTMLLYGLGVGMRKYWYLIGLFILFCVIIGKAYLKTAKGKANIDGLILKVPLIGSLLHKMLISRFCRTMASQLQSGISMLQSLETTRDVMGNAVMANILIDTRKAVEEGKPMIESLQKSRQFPPDVIQMIAAGEETGKIHEMMDKVADFYDTTIEHTIGRLLALIEPVLIIIMGGVAGLIMASMILPLFDMVKTIQS